MRSINTTQTYLPNMVLKSTTIIRLATEEDALPLERLINTAFRDDKTTQVFLAVDHASVDVTSADQLKTKIAQPDCSTRLCGVRRCELGGRFIGPW